MPHPAPHRPRLRLAAILPVLIVTVVLGCASHVLITASFTTSERYFDGFTQWLFDEDVGFRRGKVKTGAWPSTPLDLPAGWPMSPLHDDGWSSWLFTYAEAWQLDRTRSFHVKCLDIGLPFRSAAMADAYVETHEQFDFTISRMTPPRPTEMDRLITFRSRLHLVLDPTRILWPGFIANTLVFAAVYLAFFTAFRQIRRSLRRRRNLCPNCAYSRADLSPATPCPECGHVISLKPPEHA